MRTIGSILIGFGLGILFWIALDGYRMALFHPNFWGF